MALSERLNGEVPEWMTRVSGMKGLMDYFEREAIDKPIETIVVEHITVDELKRFQKSFCSFIETTNNPFLGVMSEYTLKGNPIMLSLVTKQYEKTDKLLDQIEHLTLQNVGRISKIDATNMFGPLVSEDNKYEYSFLNYLYEPEFIAEKKLRAKLLSRLENEAADLYDFNLARINSFNEAGVKKQFLQDIETYPKLFKRVACLYANDMNSLLFLMKTFSDEKSIRQLLSNNSIGLYSIDGFQPDKIAVIDADIRSLGNIVKFLQKRTDTHIQLFCFMLKMITELRRCSLLIKNDYYTKAESMIWEYIMQLPFEEKQFTELLSTPERELFRMEIAYELAHRKLKKRMPLFINCYFMASLEDAFGLNSDKDHIHSNGFFCEDDFCIQKGRLFRLVNDIGEIHYAEEKLWNQHELGKEIGDFLALHAENIKDVFADLLMHGFVPKECLDAVFQRITRNKKCIYMRPLLIAYKYGGLEYDQG